LSKDKPAAAKIVKQEEIIEALVGSKPLNNFTIITTKGEVIKARKATNYNQGSQEFRVLSNNQEPRGILLASIASVESSTWKKNSPADLFWWGLLFFLYGPGHPLWLRHSPWILFSVDTF